MSSTHDHPHFEPGSTITANQETSAEDPTETKTHRKKKSQEFNSRWATVRGILRETLEKNDALRLRDIDHGPETMNIPGTLRASVVDDFGAESNADRLSRFGEWFRNVLEAHVLEPTSEDQVKEGRHYSAETVDRAYARGLALANRDLRQSSLPDPDTGEEGSENPSDLIARDRHQDTLKQERELLYDDIDRAVNETHTEANRSLAENLGYAAAGGITIRELTNRVTGRVDAVGQTRTETSVHTRVVESVNRAVIERGFETGVSEVGITIEYGEDEDEPEYDFTTAEDSRVCVRCAQHEGSSWTLSEIRSGDGVHPPLHPRCRCLLRLRN